MFTSAAFRNGAGGSGIAIRAAGETVRVIRRAVLASSPVEVAYRALLHGLWRARTTGTRHVRAYVDNAHLAAQLGGSEDVPPELTGLYLQIRALLNAYRWSRVEFLPRAQNAEAAIAAVEALDQDPRLHEEDLDAPEPLPLFSSAGSTT